MNMLAKAATNSVQTDDDHRQSGQAGRFERNPLRGDEEEAYGSEDHHADGVGLGSWDMC